MKMTLTVNDIAEALNQDENNGFSRAGAYALAEYLDDLDDQCEGDTELDVVAIRCDFSEFENLQAWIAEYYGKPLKEALTLAGIDYDGDEGEDYLDEMIRSHIQDHGQLIESAGEELVIVSSF